MPLRGVVVELSGLRDRGPGFKTRSRPLAFTRALIFQSPASCWVLIALTISSEFCRSRHAEDVKALELGIVNWLSCGSSDGPRRHKFGQIGMVKEIFPK